VPPDLRSGSTRKWWDVPPESVYAFTFYIWQHSAGRPMASRLPAQPARAVGVPHAELPAFLQQDYEYRRSNGELRQRVRGIYEIPGRGYGDDPATRVRTVSAATGSSRWT
jgi:integrating conjugative element protein (TIGR03746 family)